MIPWKATPEQEATEGHYADFAAWEDWLQAALNRVSGGTAGDDLMGSSDLDKVWLYSVMCNLCEGGPTMKPLAELMELLNQFKWWQVWRVCGQDRFGCTMYKKNVKPSPMEFGDTPEAAIHRALCAAGILTLEDE